MGLFSGFRKKQSRLGSALDLGRLQVDMHSHLIPGIDDGVRSIHESLSLIKQFQNLGYSKLVVTPHIMTDYYKNTPSVIRAGLNDLKSAVSDAGISIELEAAAEYMVDIGFRDKAEAGELMTFGDNYVLIELSYLNPPPDLNNLVFDMSVAGYKVVLAHPERYAYWYDDLGVFEELINRGVYLQLNLTSLAGFYSREVRKVARTLIDRGWYSFAGSDVHNTDYMQSVEESAYEPYLEKLLDSGNLRNATL